MTPRRDKYKAPPTIRFGWSVRVASGPKNFDGVIYSHLSVVWDTPDGGWVSPAGVFFKTRSAARAWLGEHYGYMRTRKDLKTYPHDRKMPRVVRVKLTLEEIG